MYKVDSILRFWKVELGLTCYLWFFVELHNIVHSHYNVLRDWLYSALFQCTSQVCIRRTCLQNIQVEWHHLIEEAVHKFLLWECSKQSPTIYKKWWPYIKSPTIWMCPLTSTTKNHNICFHPENHHGPQTDTHVYIIIFWSQSRKWLKRSG